MGKIKIKTILLIAIILVQLIDAYTRHGDLWRLILGIVFIAALTIWSVWGKKPNKCDSKLQLPVVSVSSLPKERCSKCATKLGAIKNDAQLCPHCGNYER